MEIKLIKTETEYEAALTRVEALMDAEPGSAREDELELLALLVEKYEDEHYPIGLPDPIEAVKFRMEQEGLSRKDMIQYLGSQSKVSEVLNYKRPLSLSMIRALNEGLDIPAEVLLGGSDRPENMTTISKQDEEVQADIYSNCQQLMEELNKNTLQKWLSKINRLAMEQDLPAYDRDGLNEGLFRELTRLSCYSAGPQMACELLNKKGIHLVAHSTPFKTGLDGACFYTPEKRPVIGLTLRNDRLDIFWLILFHQLAHLYLHSGKKPAAFFDSIDCIFDKTAPAEEEEVNKLLREFLIPLDVWENRVLIGLETKDKVLLEQLVRSFNISPEIISIRTRLEGEEGVYTQLFTPKKISEKLEVYDYADA